MHCGILFLLAIAFVQFCGSAPSKRSADSDPAKVRGKGRHLKDADIQTIKDNCNNKKANKCKGQTDEYKAKRQHVKDNLLREMKHRHPTKSDADAEAEVETHLGKIHALAKKWHELNGLSDVDPADVGLYQSDIMLTSEQADKLLERLTNPPRTPADGTTVAPTRKRRAAAINFELYLSSRWTMPVHYWINQTDFTAEEITQIDAGLNTITNSTTIIQFIKDAANVDAGPQIQYKKVGTNSCGGSSPVGRLSGKANIISLQTGACGAGSYLLKAIIMHETIHSLGGGHEQARTDRDQFLTVLFANIDPQMAFNYAMDSDSITYGVMYDYKSRMHYQQGLFALTSGLKTMEPKVSMDLGSLELTANDIAQLKAMYNLQPQCIDYDTNCKYWLSDCLGGEWKDWMINNCRKSCAFC